MVVQITTLAMDQSGDKGPLHVRLEPQGLCLTRPRTVLLGEKNDITSPTYT